VRSIVSRVADGDHARLADVARCPTQFQEYVGGRDFRVHVIGDQVFPAEVVSEADDYRYASRGGKSVAIWAANLSSDVASQCRSLAAGLGLATAGIDLRRTPSGRWYCFEVNPSPGFSYYENATGQPLALSVARFLQQGHKR
jgi:D-alanine-D-alanine ligase-like ATP-grasp enzyme